MHSVRIEVAKLNLVGTRTTHHATGDAGIGENNVEPTAKRSSLCFYDTTMYNATMVLRYGATMVLWYYGSRAVRTILLWNYCTMVQRYYGNMVLRYYDTVILWYYGTIGAW